MESKQLQQIAESWFGAELDKTIFQESKEAALYYKEQYLATYRAGFREGQKQAQPGAVWVKATDIEIKLATTYYVQWEDEKWNVKGSGYFSKEGIFLWDNKAMENIPKIYWNKLLILDESAAGREEDAVAFAQWLANERWQPRINTEWARYETIYSDVSVKTTAELYELFKQQKEK